MPLKTKAKDFPPFICPWSSSLWASCCILGQALKLIKHFNVKSTINDSSKPVFGHFLLNQPKIDWNPSWILMSEWVKRSSLRANWSSIHLPLQGKFRITLQITVGSMTRMRRPFCSLVSGCCNTKDFRKVLISSEIAQIQSATQNGAAMAHWWALRSLANRSNWGTIIHLALWWFLRFSAYKISWAD